MRLGNGMNVEMNVWFPPCCLRSTGAREAASLQSVLSPDIRGDRQGLRVPQEEERSQKQLASFWLFTF